MFDTVKDPQVRFALEELHRDLSQRLTLQTGASETVRYRGEGAARALDTPGIGDARGGGLTAAPNNRWGSESSYVTIDEEGVLHLVGDATVWDDLRFPAASVTIPGAAGSPTWDTANFGWLFAAAATNDLQIVAQLPHGYKAGSAIYPHVCWEPADATAGNVLWRVSWRWRNTGEKAGATANKDNLAAASGNADVLQVDSWSGLDKASQAAGMTGEAGLSSIVELTLSRVGGDVSDTYAADARLKAFNIHYEIDAIGSREPFVK